MKGSFAGDHGRRSWPRWIARVAVVLTLLSLSVYADNAWPKAGGRPAHASLWLSRVRCDLGRLRPKQEAEAVVTIKNEGAVALVIQPPTTTCGCQVPKLARATIPPGESTTLTLRQVASKESGPFLQMVFLETNDPLQPKATVFIEGTVTNGVIVRPEPVDLGAMEPGETRTRDLEVRSDDGVPFSLTFCDGGGGIVAEAAIGKPALLHRIKVTARAGQSHGFSDERLSFTIDKKGSAPFIVPIRGEVRGSISVAPASMIFGGVEPGSPLTRKLTVYNRSGSFEVQSATVDHAEWRVERFELSGAPAARTRFLELALRPPTQPGTTEARLTLRIGTTDGKSVQIIVPIFAVVAQPATGGEEAGGP